MKKIRKRDTLHLVLSNCPFLGTGRFYIDIMGLVKGRSRFLEAKYEKHLWNEKTGQPDKRVGTSQGSRKKERRNFMNKKFKRLLSALLAIVMVFSGLQFGGWTQEAKAVTAGTTIYFDTNGDAKFTKDNAIPVVLFKTGKGEGDAIGDWADMEFVKGNIYSATIPDGATHVQFRRSNDTKSGTEHIELKDTVNYYQVKDSGWVYDNWSNTVNWLYETVITPAAFAGKTIYVTGSATVKLSTGDTVTGTQLKDADGNALNVYKYTFGETVEEGTTFSIAVGDTTYVTGATSVNSATPLYNTETSAWEAYTEPVTKVTIYLGFPSGSSPNVWLTKNGTVVQTLTGVTSFEYDLLSTTYDGFYAGWDGDGNQTDKINLSEIKTNVTGKKKVQLTIGGWNSGNNRTHTWTDAAYVGDASLNIPSGSITKETGAYYVSTTFYDYYSDVELTGVNRNTLTGGFDSSDGSNDKIQARTFNEAVSAYFYGKLSGTSFKPLYFGEFTKAAQSYYLYDFAYNNVSGGANGSGAHQGLIDSTLNSDKNATMNGIELPYFNEEFLRGENSADQAIGQVFENVQFPFKKNSQDYWEFDSSVASQTLRMKQDSTTKEYYLDRVGSNGAVYGVKSDGSTSLGFFPFNDAAESKNAKKLNYAFGVRFDIPFTMTADGKYGEGENKQDIVYNFSGDDDVWVFIDGKLALDIGGDHGEVSGYINFATKKVYVEGSGEKSFSDLGITVEANKQHTLTMFYMERGIWESNMKITFNFPQINTFAVNMEVDASNVNALFADIVKKKLSGFDVLVQNYATRGTDLAGATITETEKTYNSLDSEDSSTIYSEGSPEQIGILTSTTDSNNKSGREDVLLVKYKAQLKDTADANGHRVIICPEEGTTFDASSVSDYLQFDMYNEGRGSTGVPYVYLVDKSGNKIYGWANSSVAYNGNNNTLTRNKWVTVQVDLAKLKGDNSFNFNEITEIRIGYWDSGYTYIDNITFHKEATTETKKVEFKTPQYDVPTYRSIETKGLVNATGAIYKQQRGDDTTSQSYVIGTDGKIRLSNGDTAFFTDQFRIGSYINLEESVDPNYFTTRWELSEGGSVYSSGDGRVIDDNRTELAEYAAETVKDGTALMTLNDGVTQPESALLYRSYARTDDVITPTHIEATFYNSVNVGSLKIQKKLENLEGGEYNFKITFSNVMGIADTEVETTVTLNASNGYCKTIENIPVGTNYVIEEVIAADVANKYTVTNIEHTSGNDSGSGDVANKKYAGILSLGAEDVQDVITFTNAPIPVTVDKVFFVESETETTLPMDLEELSYFDEVAVPDSSEEASIFLQEGTTTDADGNVVPDNNVKFDAPYVNEDEETEPSKSVPNEKYTFTYSGKDNNGTDADGNPTTRLVTGTVTIYTFKAYDDVYVFDYGLKSDLADTASGNGLFQNDILFNENVTTIASFTGLKNTGDAFQASINNEQSTITGDIAALKQIGSTNGASLDGTVIFQPTAFMDKVETFYYQASVFSEGKTTISSPADGVNLSASVKVMPASVVYYEDNFASAITYTGTTDGETPTLIINNTAINLTQSNDQSEQYGYDDAYVGTEYDGDGNVTGVVTGDSAGGSTALVADGYNTKATFTFTGTGFDIIARTTTTTAGIYCIIEKVEGSTVTLKKTISVDTYYANGDLYQIPVIHEIGLDHGTYQVTLGIMADTEKERTTVYLDGIRIYNPLEVDSAYIDNEKDATITKVGDLIVGNGTITETGIDGVINGQTIEGATAALLGYTDASDTLSPMGYSHVENSTNGTQSILTYLNAGPNNEVYLNDNAAFAFVATGKPSESNTIQIEAKLLNTDSYMAEDPRNAEPIALKIINNNKQEQVIGTVASATAMYYEIPVSDCISLGNDKYLVVIIGGTNACQCLALSNLKVNGYALSNPYTDASAYIQSNTTATTVFASIDTFSDLSKNVWSNYAYKVTLKTDVFAGSKAKFKMYYVGADGTKTAITVYAKAAGDNVYLLKFKTPNATGEFPVQIYADVEGDAGKEYISTIMSVQ